MGLQECVKACSPLAPSREGSNLVTSPIVRIAPVALAVALLIPLGARAQDSECVSCHTARYASFSSDERAHFDDWRESIHAAAGVGCTACHEGNSEAETRAEAHDGVLGSSPPASPVHARNIPATCGACHTEQRLSFETSRHHQRLLDAVEGAPSCLTCHGAVSAEFPETRGVESVCASCHGPGRSVPMSEYHTQVRLMRELVETDRRDLARIREAIERVQDPDTRQSLGGGIRRGGSHTRGRHGRVACLYVRLGPRATRARGEQVSELLERLGLR